MSALVFTLRNAPAQRVDAGTLNPTALAGLSVADIAALTLQIGKRTVRVDEVFSLEGDDTADVVFRGDCGKFERIGAGMKSGRVTVEGHAGAYVGQGMLGGTIVIGGNAGAFCATGMKGGRIEVAGDVAEFAGGAIPGEMKGMAGGLLLVGGNAGERLGDRMRRGQILVSGNAGDYTVSASSACSTRAGKVCRGRSVPWMPVPARSAATWATWAWSAAANCWSALDDASLVAGIAASAGRAQRGRPPARDRSAAAQLDVAPRTGARRRQLRRGTCAGGIARRRACAHCRAR